MAIYRNDVLRTLFGNAGGSGYRDNNGGDIYFGRGGRAYFQDGSSQNFNLSNGRERTAFEDLRYAARRNFLDQETDIFGRERYYQPASYFRPGTGGGFDFTGLNSLYDSGFGNGGSYLGNLLQSGQPQFGAAGAIGGLVFAGAQLLSTQGDIGRIRPGFGSTTDFSPALGRQEPGYPSYGARTSFDPYRGSAVSAFSRAAQGGVYGDIGAPQPGNNGIDNDARETTVADGLAEWKLAKQQAWGMG